MNVHQDEIVRIAASQALGPGVHRRDAAGHALGPVAELGQQGADQQRVDLVVLGDQDGEASRRPSARRSPVAARVRSVGASSDSSAASEAARTGLIR